MSEKKIIIIDQMKYEKIEQKTFSLSCGINLYKLRVTV